MEVVTRTQYLKNKKDTQKAKLETMKTTNLNRCIRAINSGRLIASVSVKPEIQSYIKKELAKAGWGVTFFTKDGSRKNRDHTVKRTWAKFGDLK